MLNAVWRAANEQSKELAKYKPPEKDVLKDLNDVQELTDDDYDLQE